MSWGFYVMIAFLVVALIKSILDHMFNLATREADNKKRAEKAERNAAKTIDRDQW